RLSATETRIRRSRIGCQFDASMEPSPLSDGDLLRALLLALIAVASMEPSPLSDGDAQASTKITWLARLQWSRRLSATETSPSPAPPSGTPGGFNGAVASQRRRPRRGAGPLGRRSRLQWSRRLSATETRTYRRRSG